MAASSAEVFRAEGNYPDDDRGTQPSHRRARGGRRSRLRRRVRRDRGGHGCGAGGGADVVARTQCLPRGDGDGGTVLLDLQLLLHRRRGATVGNHWDCGGGGRQAGRGHRLWPALAPAQGACHLRPRAGEAGPAGTGRGGGGAGVAQHVDQRRMGGRRSRVRRGLRREGRPRGGAGRRCGGRHRRQRGCRLGRCVGASDGARTAQRLLSTGQCRRERIRGLRFE